MKKDDVVYIPDSDMIGLVIYEYDDGRLDVLIGYGYEGFISLVYVFYSKNTLVKIGEL